MVDTSKLLQLGGRLLLWILSILAGVAMILAGGGKLAGSVWVDYFQQWGYPAWFRILVGLAQVGGGLALFVPRIAAYGAGLLVIVMAGAVITELIKDPPFSGPTLPTVFGGVYLLIFVARRRRAIGPLGPDDAPVAGGGA